jgi:hypothetical protein
LHPGRVGGEGFTDRVRVGWWDDLDLSPVDLPVRQSVQEHLALVAGHGQDQGTVSGRVEQ